MIQIRNNVFETNSSSSHAFVILPNNTREKSRTDLDYLFEKVSPVSGRYKPSTKEFRRYPFKMLFLPCDKADYAIANNMGEELEEELNALYNSISPDDYVWSVNHLKEDGIKHIKVQKGVYGVDDLKLRDWLKDNGVSFHDYLTDGRYVVICDGDEYNYLGRLLDLGLFSSALEIDR